MELHLMVLLLLAGLSGTGSLKTVSEVPVKAGAIISIPCLYDPQYRQHVKYLCEGYDWLLCGIRAKTNKPQDLSKQFIISDDPSGSVFVVTVAGVGLRDIYLWCAVEKQRTLHLRSYFQLSVATDSPPKLEVDHQMVKGFTGDDLAIRCRYRTKGERLWCRLDGACVGGPSGTINGITVTIVTLDSLFTVTMKGIRAEDSGWYYCAVGPLQMPVHVMVRHRPTTARLAITSPPTAAPESRTSLCTGAVPPTAPHHHGDHRASWSPPGLSIIVPVSMSVFLVPVTLFIWFMLKKCKQVRSSSAATTTEEEVSYSVVTYKRNVHSKLPKVRDTKDVEVTYSSLATLR